MIGRLTQVREGSVASNAGGHAMRVARSSVASSALLAGLLMAPGRVEAQAIGFQPGVGTIPDGVSLNATPVVSADRRYVRISLGANFSTINGFTNFPVAGGVAGGGIGPGGGGLGAGGLGGIGGGGGGAGGAAVGGGFRNVGLGGSGVPYSPEYLEASRQAAAQAKLQQPEKAKPGKGKKALADPVMVPMKKPAAKAKPAAAQGLIDAPIPRPE
jgi:hypothetical protein